MIDDLTVDCGLKAVSPIDDRRVMWARSP